MIYSYSRLKSYENCPKKFYFHYVEGVPEISSQVASKGIEIHQLIEKELNFELQIIDDKNIEKQVENAVKFTANLDILQLEHHFQNEKYQGYIDCVASEKGEIVLIDWKTGFGEPDPMQLYFYALNFSEPVRKGYFVMLNTNDIIEVSITPEYIERARTWAEELIEKIEHEAQFNEKPNPLCSYCSYLEKCAKTQKLEITKLRNEKEIEEAFKQIDILNEYVKSLKGKIRDFAKNNGNITINGKTFGEKVSETWKITDEQGLREFLESKNYDYLAIDTKKLKKLDEDLSEFVKISQRKTYDFIGGNDDE